MVDTLTVTKNTQQSEPLRNNFHASVIYTCKAHTAATEVSIDDNPMKLITLDHSEDEIQKEEGEK